MYDPTTASFINGRAMQILRRLEEEARNPNVRDVLPEESDLVLELVLPPDGEPTAGYYFADHGSKLLFWMDEFDAGKICGERRCPASIAHLRRGNIFELYKVKLTVF